jgi:hypothetical protein
MLTAGVLLAGVMVFAHFVDRHYPIRQWLLLRYVGYTFATAYAGSACLAIGFATGTALGGRTLRFSERLLVSFAAGVLLFGITIFAAGVVGVYGPAFFWAAPAALLALSGRSSLARLGRGSARLTRAIWRAGREPSSLARARCVFLALGLVAVYLQVITPDNMSFDARWYHVALAEQYVAQHAIERFPDGWYLGAYPQLATWLYTWAFQAPGVLFDRVLICAHLEWLLFLATAYGVGLLVRRVVPGARVRWAAAALFLFPSLLIYDSNLNIGADHAVAFWAIPIALALAAARRALTWQSSVLFAAMCSGAVLTKYQGIYLLVPAFVVALALVLRARRAVLVVPSLLALLALTAPHWLKNAIYYGDPMYPLLNGYLPTHPFHPGALAAMDGTYFPKVFLLDGTVLERLGQALQVLFTFSFLPHNWDGHHIVQPTFGSLFTLFTLAVPLLGRKPRLWVLLGSTYAGVFIWFWTNHQDRFLQALLPWMVVCTAAIIARVWALGPAARAGAAVLIVFQVAWGADAFFYPNHRLIKAAPVTALARLMEQSFRGRYAERFDRFGEIPKLAAFLPSDARVLVHGQVPRLGLARRAFSDELGFQGFISYRELPTAREVWNRWRELGVTHVVWKQRDLKRVTADSLAREAIFYEAVRRGTRRAHRQGHARVAELRPEPPADRPRALRIEGCGADPRSGTFRVTSWAKARGKRKRLLAELPDAPASDVTVLVVRESCDASELAYERTPKAGFKKVASFNGLDVWVR